MAFPLKEALDRFAIRNRSWLIPALLFCVYAATLVATQGLTHEIQDDEVHFWETTRLHFIQPFPPSTQSLREYPELITPLSYILWGQLERLTGEGLFAGRVVNFLMSMSILLLLLQGSRERERDSIAWLGASLGLLLYPYYLSLSTRLYTDMIAGFFLVFGLHHHLRGRVWWACALFTLSIASRQYLVQVPAAIAMWEAIRWLRDRSSVPLSSVIAPGIACASLLGWIAFWGGLAPQPGLDRWVPRYPAPMMSPFSFILHYGLYFLTALGVYFAVVEALVFRELPPRSRLVKPWVFVAAAWVAILFVMEPPFLRPGQPGGAFGNASRLLFPGELGDWVRILLYYVLAVFAVVRLGLAGGLSLGIATLGTIMSMKSQIPWEKYLFPCLLALWYLRSRPEQLGGMSGVQAARSG